MAAVVAAVVAAAVVVTLVALLGNVALVVFVVFAVFMASVGPLVVGGSAALEKLPTTQCGARKIGMSSAAQLRRSIRIDPVNPVNVPLGNKAIESADVQWIVPVEFQKTPPILRAPPEVVLGP